MVCMQDKTRRHWSHVGAHSKCYLKSLLAPVTPPCWCTALGMVELELVCLPKHGKAAVSCPFICLTGLHGVPWTQVQQFSSLMAMKMYIITNTVTRMR